MYTHAMYYTLHIIDIYFMCDMHTHMYICKYTFIIHAYVYITIEKLTKTPMLQMFLGVLVFFYILMETEIKLLKEGDVLGDPGRRGRCGRCQGSLYWLKGFLEPGGESAAGLVSVQDLSDPRWSGLGAEEAHSAPAKEAV